ncbi:MAG TPA: CehA/McbA family metallohydrolase [Vicinamibacteria bacterium]|nr:CehA/McbA family metallohydrolase [Vicinamibacteria bacterium]
MRKPSFTLHVVSAVTGLAMATGSIGAQEPEYPPSKHGGNYMHNFYFPPAPSSTPWAPEWSPDGEWIAVAMSGSIWKVDPNNGRAWELTYNEKYHSLPDISPDGKWLAYTADDGGATIQLEILDLETGESHALTNDDQIYLDPVFSPDGSRLAYVSTKPNGYFNVYVRPIRNGQWAGEEIPVTRDNDYGKDRLYFGPWDMAITPAWLPHGRELLLVSNRDVPLGSGNVLRVPASVDGIEESQTVLSEQTLYRTRPDVSIDGKRFIYSSTGGAADQFTNLYVQPTAGGEPYKMTFFSHDAFHPRFSPDGESIAYISNAGGLPQLALLETYGGGQRMVSITDRRWKRPMGFLAVRTVDASTSAPTGSRVHLKASDGKFYAPADAYARVSGVGDPVFHHRGDFLLEVPVGRVELTVVKGFEYWPKSLEVDVRANEVSRLAVELEPMTDMAAKGWYSGSTHVHMNYGGNLHNTLENLMMMSAAEDQDIVNEQVANKDNRILDYQFFVPGGGPHPLSTPERILVVGQEYRPPFYGHVFLFGLKDHLISPYTTGYEGTAIESLYPSNTDMFRKAKAQGATVGYVHAFGGENDPLEGNLGGAKGYMVDAALATTDAVEWSQAGRAGFYPWYATLNNGIRVTATGGEDSISNLQRSKLVGSVRTYVYTGSRGLDMDAWFEGLREGRAFVSTGPLLELTVNGRLPGEKVDLRKAGNVDIEAHVRSLTPIKNVILVSNGEVIEEFSPSGDRHAFDLKKSYPVRESGWFHLRAEGDPAERFPLDAAYAQGFTNPVWVEVAGQPVRHRASAEYSIRWIDKLRQMAEEWPGWRSEREKQHVLAQFDEARAIYQGFLVGGSTSSESPARPR